MSGSGATVFGIYEDDESASAAARPPRNWHDGWWVQADKLALGRRNRQSGAAQRNPQPINVDACRARKTGGGRGVLASPLRAGAGGGAAGQRRPWIASDGRSTPTTSGRSPQGGGNAREAAQDRSSRGAPFAQACSPPPAGRSWRWGCRRHAHRKRRRHPHPSPPRKGEGIAREAARDRSSRGAPFAQARSPPPCGEELEVGV